MTTKKGDNLKIVQEVNRRKVELIVYAAYVMGYMAIANSQRRLEHPDNFEEIKALIKQLSD